MRLIYTIIQLYIINRACCLYKTNELFFSMSGQQSMYSGNHYVSHSKLQSPLTIQWYVYSAGIYYITLNNDKESITPIFIIYLDRWTMINNGLISRSPLKPKASSLKTSNQFLALESLGEIPA